MTRFRMPRLGPLVLVAALSCHAEAVAQQRAALTPAAGGLVGIGPDNFAKKALVVRSAPGEDGRSLHVVFDTDTLRCGAAWIADGTDGVVRSAEAGTIPVADGALLFETLDVPGWTSATASPGEDSRYVARDGARVGPLNGDRGRWLGQHRAKDRIVWSYEAAGVPILESPMAVMIDGVPVLIRQFEVGPRSEGLAMRVAYDRSASSRANDADGLVFASAGRRGPSASERADRRRGDEDDDEEFEDEDFDEDDVEDPEFDEDGPLEFEGDTSLRVAKGSDFDLTGSDYTVVARLRTEGGGTIFAQAPREGEYAPDSKSLFVSDGVLQFDIGWVDVLRGESEIDDGEWHCVAVTFDAARGEATLFVDGDADASGDLNPNDAVDEQFALRIGFTSPDFPDEVRGFEGEIPGIAFYQRRLSPAELREFADGKPPAEALVAHWDRFDHENDRFVDRIGDHHAVWEDVEIADFEEEDFDEDEFEEDDEEERGRPLEFDGESVRVRFDEITLDKLRGESFSLIARVKTEKGGPLFAVAARDGSWRENNVCWFIRRGRMVFDVGFVGQVEGETPVDDGEWHTVSMFYNAENGDVRLYVDGEEDETRWIGADQADGLLPVDADGPQPETCAWIGFASDQFPERAPRFFEGRLAELRVYEGVLDGEEAQHLLELPPAETLGEIAAWRPLTFIDGAVDDQSDNGIDGIVLGVEGASNSPFPFTECLVLGDLSASNLSMSEDGHIRLTTPPGAEILRFAVAYVPRASQSEPIAPGGLSAVADGLEDLSRLTRSAAAPTVLRLEGAVTRRESGNAGFVVEELLPPADAPSGSPMQLSAIDLFRGGDAAAAVTLDGEAWLIKGLANPRATSVTWTRIATGLAEPRGVSVADGAIHVLGRGEITRLVNSRGDAAAELYECFSNAALASASPDDVAAGLTRLPDGGFAYVRGGPRDAPIATPHQGALLTVSKSGGVTEAVASGFSSAVGLSPAGGGRWWVTDRSGRGVPKGRLAQAATGDFFGAFGASPSTPEQDIAPARAWVHDDFIGGIGALVTVDSPAWPELQGNLLVLPASSGELAVALLDQSAASCTALYRLPLEPLSRVMERGRFDPDNGALYLCGHRDASTGLPGEGRIVRIRRGEATPALPTAVRPTRRGLEISFSHALDRAAAEDWRNYAASQWTYRRTDQFGSDDYRVSDPRRRGRDRLLVDATRLSRDQRTVNLDFGGLRPAPGNELKCDLQAKDGSPVAIHFHFTTTPDVAASETAGRGT